MYIAIIIASTLMALGGFMLESGKLVSTSNAVLGFGIAIIDGLNINKKRVTAISLFAFSSGLLGIGNYFVIESYEKGSFLLIGYGIPWFYTQAAYLNYLGTLFIICGGKIGGKANKNFYQISLPKVYFVPEKKKVAPIIIVIMGVGTFIISEMSILGNIGAIKNIIQTTPILSVFFLSRWGFSNNNNIAIWISLLFALLLSFDALLYAYLRGDILMPWFSFALGGISGKPILKTLKSVPFLLIFCLTFIFFTYFGMLAIVRGERIYGIERLDRLSQLNELSREGDLDVLLQHPLARRSTVNKQSQIFELVEKNGFYNGESVSYFFYVFIPRLIWPEKPIIATGQWFAKEIGMGSILESGRFSNSINMTIPGELYLNFGWTGVVVGCTCVGFLFILIWESTKFWDSENNLPGILLSFHLLSRAIGNMGPDLQSIIGYINTYLVFWGISIICNIIYGSNSKVKSMKTKNTDLGNKTANFL